MGIVANLHPPTAVKPERRLWVRRRALQIAGELPDSPEEALAVLREAERLVRGFLSDPS